MTTNENESQSSSDLEALSLEIPDAAFDAIADSIAIEMSKEFVHYAPFITLAGNGGRVRQFRRWLVEYVLFAPKKLASHLAGAFPAQSLLLAIVLSPLWLSIGLLSFLVSYPITLWKIVIRQQVSLVPAASIPALIRGSMMEG